MAGEMCGEMLRQITWVNSGTKEHKSTKMHLPNQRVSFMSATMQKCHQLNLGIALLFLSRLFTCFSYLCPTVVFTCVCRLTPTTMVSFQAH